MHFKKIAIILLIVMSFTVYALSTSNFGNIISRGNVTINGTYLNVSNNLFVGGNLNIGTDTEWLSIYSLGSTGYFNSTLPIRITNNVSVDGSINITGNYTFSNGGNFWCNATCCMINSPAGTGQLQVCD